MDQSELVVESYLRARGFSNIVYEPDGNVPPDFLVEGRIAIEVRRLNQNVVDSSGKHRGLEEAFVPTCQRIEKLLPMLGPSVQSECWYVGVDIGRPLESWRVLEPRLRSTLTKFMQMSSRREMRVAISDHLSIELVRAGTDRGRFFMLGMVSDDDSGGFVVSEQARNLDLCLEEKARKVALYRDRYPEWWIVLPDHIGYASNAEDQRQLREIFKSRHGWDKVILVSPIDPMHAFEI